MNASTHPEPQSSPSAGIPAVVEPLPPLLYRSEAFAEDLEPELSAAERWTLMLHGHLGALLYSLPLGLALAGAGGTLWAGVPF